ncbi:MAG: SDR family NAD(P)-dependent oxidoreductase, partial [Pirellulales bacterium]|nr:SDR family NAD(P)-dependent oxidoreductase [Pirellulales bacterium]
GEVLFLRGHADPARFQPHWLLEPPAQAQLTVLVSLPRDMPVEAQSVATSNAVTDAGLRDQLIDRIIQEFAKTLGQPTDEIELDANVMDLGFDSILAIQFNRRFASLLGEPLPPTLLFQHPTATSLAEYLVANKGVQVTKLLQNGTETQASNAPRHAEISTTPLLNITVEPTTPPIAIVGIGLRLPGAETTDEFWSLLREGRDAIGPLPRNRFGDLETDTTSERGASDSGVKLNEPLGGYLPDISAFDPAFFHLSAREARLMDPQQRLLLEVSWEALENAGYRPSALPARRTGVFVGSSTLDYVKLFSSPEDRGDPHARTGNSLSMLANRISYMLGLEGPSLTLDTACSSALVAVHLACQSLRAGECQVALAGGVHLNLNPEGQAILEREQILAADGRSKAFDERADGFGRGEGAAVVLLKPLSAALVDGDTVWGVIRGSAVNNDGHAKAGLAAPNPRAQCECITEAYRQAGLNPASIGYLEAHGTGTPLGDPLEIEGLAEAFKRHTSVSGFCAIGSVKTNLGHLEAAAGIAGLIKALLMLTHGQRVPTLHLSAPNRAIQFEQTPFFLADRWAPWPRTGQPRRVGVSSFGLGGTNAHVVLEEAPQCENQDKAPAERPRLLLFSARSEPALRELARRYATHLSQNSQQPLSDFCSTINSGRAWHRARAAITISSREQVIQRLLAFADGKTSAASHRGLSPRRAPRVHLFFARHFCEESQIAAVAQRLTDNVPAVRQAIEEVLVGLGSQLSDRVRARLFASSYSRAVAEPEFVLFANAVLQFAVARQLQHWGVVAATTHGAGSGQLAAHWLSTSKFDRIEPILEANTCDVGLVVPPGSTQYQPGHVLLLIGDSSNLADEGAFNNTHVITVFVDSIDPVGQLHSAARELFCTGVDLNGEALTGDVPWRRVPAPTYPFDRIRLWVNSEQTTALPDATTSASVKAAVVVGPSSRGSTGGVSQLFYRPTLEELPELTCRTNSRANEKWLVFADQEGVGDDLARQMRQSGAACVIVRAGRRFEPLGHDSYSLNPDAPGEFAQLPLALCAESFTPLNGIVFLWSLRRPRGVDLTLPELRNRLTEGAEALVHISKHFLTDTTGEVKICGATCDASVHTDIVNDSAEILDEVTIGPLLQSIGREFPGVRTCWIDFECDASAHEMAESIYQELDNSDSEDVVMRRGGRRWRPAFVPFDPRAAESSLVQIQRDGVYLITGGLGDLGRTVATWLVDQGARRLVLVGRTNLPDALAAEALHSTELGEPIANRIAIVHELTARGADVWAPAVDITNPQAVSQLFESIDARYGRLDGVVHAAGILSDGVLWNRALADVRAVLYPKVLGAWLLHESTRRRSLDFFVLFSSTAAFAPLAGQASYAAANAYLDRLARYRHSVGLPALSINWGFWGASRAVAPARYRQFIEQSGMRPLSSADATQAFAAALSLRVPQVGIFDVDRRPTRQVEQSRQLDDGIALRLAPGGITTQTTAPSRSVIDSSRLFQAVSNDARRTAAPLVAMAAQFRDFSESLDEFTLEYVARAFKNLLEPLNNSARWSREEIIRRFQVLPRFKRFADQWIDELINAGWLVESTALQFARTLPDTPLSVRSRAAAARLPFARSHFELLDRCGSNLAAVLRGKIEPLEVLFPDGVFATAEALYQDFPFAQYFNELLRSAVRGFAQQQLDRPLRVIELGAGTGSSTVAILSALPPGSSYDFTDVSDAFLKYGANKFLSRDSLRFRLLDIEQGPASQGFPVGSFDVVVAANVLHATRRIEQSLKHARSLLAPGGLLLLVELTSVERWVQITFGLTEGWWRFAGDPFRATSPLLSKAAWIELLHKCGFGQLATLPDSESGLPPLAQHLFLATAADAWHPRESDVRFTAEEPISVDELTTDTGLVRAITADVVDSSDDILRKSREQVRSALASVLRVDVQSVDLNAAFQEQGIDSLLALELVGKLKSLFGLTSLSPTKIFAHPSCSELGNYLASIKSASRLSVASGEGRRDLVSELSASIAPVQAVVSMNASIAVVGYACRFPGAATATGFWRLL